MGWDPNSKLWIEAISKTVIWVSSPVLGSWCQVLSGQKGDSTQSEAEPWHRTHPRAMLAQGHDDWSISWESPSVVDEACRMSWLSCLSPQINFLLCICFENLNTEVYQTWSGLYIQFQFSLLESTVLSYIILPKKKETFSEFSHFAKGTILLFFK